MVGLALLLSITACINDSTSPEQDRTGRYRLRTINGDQLPAFVSDNKVGRIDFTSGTLRLNPDSTYTDSTGVRFTYSDGVRNTTDVSSGRYTIRNDTVIFSSVRGERYQMVFLSEVSLRQDLVGSVLLYVR
jgi:hypothetical protein